MNLKVPYLFTEWFLLASSSEAHVFAQDKCSFCLMFVFEELCS